VLQIPCPHCKNYVVTDAQGRFPPWCRKCGADLKFRPEDLETATPAASEPPLRVPGFLSVALVPEEERQAHARPTTANQPPCFHAQVLSGQRRLYRIYLAEGELLFLDRTPWRPPAVLGGLADLFAGILGGLIVKAVAEEGRKKWMARVREMDSADELRLQVMVDEDENSFRAQADKLSGVVINPPTFWQRWGVFTPRCAGVLRLRHSATGELALGLSLEDMRWALRELPRFLGGEVAVNAVWDGGRDCFVPAGSA
jgi:hypothetical protein